MVHEADEGALHLRVIIPLSGFSLEYSPRQKTKEKCKPSTEEEISVSIIDTANYCVVIMKISNVCNHRFQDQLQQSKEDHNSDNDITIMNIYG